VKTSTARVTITSLSPLSQSRQHDEPKLDGELMDAYDKRTWRSKLNVDSSGDTPTVVLPAHGLHQAIISAAKYSSKQIPGQGKKTWAKKMESGITLMANVPINIDPATVMSVTISANADGVRGSGKRVPRTFPVIPVWSATFDVIILDPIITQVVFREMLELAGMFIGLGRFRPEKAGTNGRFTVTALSWGDSREMAA